MFNVYNDHKGSHTQLLPVRQVEHARDIAFAYAHIGQDALFRVFQIQYDPETLAETGEQFITAFSVVSGAIREHTDVTIPTEHW